ncbi:MAG: hypothetical protein ACJ748_12615 [Flavisolibacter sp.]
MKKLLPVSILCLLTLSSFCQHSQLALSEDFKIAEKEYKDQTVTHSVYHNNCFYTATNSGIGGNYKWAFTKLYDLKYAVTISKFDKNMNKIKDLEIEKGEKLFGPLAPQLIILDNKLCLVYFQSDNKNSFNLFLALVDENDLTLKQPKKVCTLQQENVGIFKMESVLNAGLVFFTNSGDNMKTLVACNASPNTIQTFVIDNDLNILKQSVLHTNTSGFNISSAVLTNDKTECMLLVSDQETKIVCNSAEGKKSEMKLSQSGNLLPNATNATLSKDGKRIYIYSTSSLTGNNDKNCSGLLLSQLDCSTMKLSRPVSYEFSPEVIEKVYQKGGGSKHKKEYFMYNFMPNLIELDNGNLVIVGSPEQTTTSISTSAPNMENKTQQLAKTTFEVGPVLAFFLNKTGKTFDYVLIPRNITSTRVASSGTGAIKIVQSPKVSHSYSNFTTTNLGDEILVIYNDNEDNLKRSEDEKIAEAHSTKDLVLAEALINKNKKLEYRKQIGENAGKNYTYYLGNTVPTSSSLIIFPLAKQGVGFNARKTFYSNWCFLDIK